MAAPTTPTVILIVLNKIRLARRKWGKKGASLLVVESTVERDWRYLYIVDKSNALLLLLLAEEK